MKFVHDLITNCKILLYSGVRSCPSKAYYALTQCKINQYQLYLSLVYVPIQILVLYCTVVNYTSGFKT